MIDQPYAVVAKHLDRRPWVRPEYIRQLYSPSVAAEGVLKMAFLDRFFPLELREQKLVEFMNLRQGNMSVKEYSLKFTQLSKYAPTLVANSRARMNKFVMGVSDLVEEECHTAMLHHDMDISRLMAYA